MVDLHGFRLTFDDEFNSFSVSANGTGTTWADTRPGSLLRPGVDIGFGQSAFVDASTGIQPFSLANGALRIEAAPVTGAAADLVYPGLYSSGLIQSLHSFSQAYGYFEMRADLPEEPGTWPGFWLLATNGVWPPELDIVETYGSDPTALTNTVHTAQSGQPTYQTIFSSQPTLTSGYHTFGALWTPETITFYYDGEAVGQVATPADMHGAMYPVIALAMQRDVAGITGHSEDLKVDYVRIYSNNPQATAIDLQTISSPDGADTSNLHGAGTASYTPPDPQPPTTGLDTLTIHISGDSWNGPPQFILNVDGRRVGEIFKVDALHALGQSQDVTVTGDFGAGPHNVAITYINDANAGAYYDAAAGGFVNDRNLFVSGITLDGVTYDTKAVIANTAAAGYDWLDPHAAVMAADGTLTFATAAGTSPPVTSPPVTTPPVTTPPTPSPQPPVPTSGADTLTIHISGDSWNGPPQFTLSVDGNRVGGTFSVEALHALGQSQDVTVTGDFGAGPHNVAITYINDANAGAYYDAAAGGFVNDRNLFVSGITLDGVSYDPKAVVANTAAAGFDWLDPHDAVMAANGTVTFATSGGTTPAPTPAPTPVTPTGNDTVTIHISGDSWNGPPRFTLSVDGQRVGDSYAVDALHALGQSQDVTVTGAFGNGPHRVAISYVNDANAGAYYDAAAGGFVNDRNLFVSGLTFNGTHYGSSAIVSNSAAIGFDWLDPHAAVMAANGTLTYDLL